MLSAPESARGPSPQAAAASPGRPPPPASPEASPSAPGPTRSGGSSKGGERRGRSGRLAPLDGLRGLAVLAVLAFHFGVGWSPGGFLGVDVFYVLSGYLITGILVRQFGSEGTVALGAFWARRARRLLPALFLVVLAVALYVRYVALPGTYLDFRGQALSTIFYFSNWYQIGQASNYFVATGAPSPLTHTWSLAIEEQFYLVWPLVVLGVLRSSGGVAGRRRLLWLAVGGAVVSQIWMAWGLHHGWSTTRLYFGTDTHAEGILVGSALALLSLRWRDSLHREGRHRRHRSGTSGRSLAGGLAAGTGLAALVLLVVETSGTSAFLYEGGFLLVAFLAALVVWGVTAAPRSLPARLLSLRVLAWLGLVSYGVYLWHFPLALYLSPARTGLQGWELLAVRCAATVALAAASYYLVERPVMTRTFWRHVRALPVAASATGLTVLAVIGLSVASVGASPKVQRFHLARTDQGGAFSPSSGSATGPTGGTVPAAPPPHVIVLGDSTALTLAFALQATAPKGTVVVNGGHFACGLAVASEAESSPAIHMALADACQPGTPPSQQWPALDAKLVAGTTPADRVVFLAGHWETQSLLVNGKWEDLTQPAFREYELRQLRELVRVATAHGAHLVLLTMPCMDTTAEFGVAPVAADSATRRHLFNQLLNQVASEYPDKVSVVNYGGMLCPGGRFRTYIGGVQVRTPDGVHTPAYAPGNVFAGNASEPEARAFYNWLSPRLWPSIIDPPRPSPAGS